jgi:maleate isomerase
MAVSRGQAHSNESFLDLGAFPFETDEGIGSRANIGLIVLATDQTIEHEFAAVAGGAGLCIYHTRIFNDAQITAETLRRMEDRIPAAVDLLPPGIDFDVIAYGCTSGAMVIGEARVAEQVRSVRPGVAVTDPVTAMRAAFDALSVCRIGLLTPYLPEVNNGLRTRLVERGLEVPVMGSFHEGDDNKVARIAPASVLDAIERIGSSDDCDGVFVSCTSLRLVAIVEEAETRIGKPVSSSNHALMWHTLRLAGCAAKRTGCGRLFET